MFIKLSNYRPQLKQFTTTDNTRL